MKYLRKVAHATSVKEIYILQETTARHPGLADFKYRPVFSVFDYGTIEPPVPLDNSTINLMMGLNFENMAEQGIPSHYVGLVTDKWELITAKEAITRKEAPTIARVKFANRFMPRFQDGQWDYSMFENGETKCYVQPIEFISRNDLPEASSVWKRVKKGEITMQDLGLPADFKPGDRVPENLKPILDYSTKFEPDDRYLSPAQAQQLMAIDFTRFNQINLMTKRASVFMTDYAASRGFERLDGKVEYVTFLSPSDGKTLDVLGDAVCTWHEDRLVTPQGLGISKQRIRNKVKELNPEWYAEIERAKQQAKDEGIEDFRTLMNPGIEYTSPSPEFFEAINQLFRAGTNQWVGTKVYDVFPANTESLEDNLARAVEEFKRVA